MAAQRKVDHAIKVLESFQMLREEGFNCDFIIKVGSESFNVHRNILSACSDYFKAMFSHDTKEVEDGYVEMKDVEEEGVKQCVEFMYKGEANITLDNAQHVLHTAALMQINLLTDHCFEVLIESLNEENCFIIKRLSLMYNSENTRKLVDCFLIQNLEKILNSEGFLQLDQSDLIDIIKDKVDIDIEDRWKAISSWVKHDENRKQYFFELVKMIDFEKFTFSFLISTIWGDPLVQESDDCKHLVVVYLFSNHVDLQRYINAQNCFLLKEIAMTFKVEDPKIMQAINEFMQQNFEQIATESKFETLSQDDVLHLFKVVKSSHWHQMHTDIVKWKAAIKWVNQDVENKKSVFPELFKCIKFEWFPLTYIKDTVRVEPLVKDSHECKDILMEVICNKAIKMTEDGIFRGGSFDAGKPKPKIECANFVVILDRRQKELKGFNVEHQEWHKIADMHYVTSNGFSFVVNVGNRLYVIHQRFLYQLQHDGYFFKKADMDFKHDRSTKVIAFRDRIYVISCTTVADYNTKADIWTELIQPDNFRAGFCLAATADHIYAIGGFPFTNQMRRYSPGNMSWTACEGMRHERSNASAEYVLPYIYVMGGRYDDMILDCCERYNVGLQQWTAIPTMQLQRSNFSSCVIDGKVYAVGGHGSIEYYDSEETEWEVISGINMRPYGMSACAFSCWVCKHPPEPLGSGRKTLILS